MLQDTKNLKQSTLKDGRTFLLQLSAWSGKPIIQLVPVNQMTGTLGDEDVKLSLDAAARLIDSLRDMIEHARKLPIRAEPLETPKRNIARSGAEPLLAAEADD